MSSARVASGPTGAARVAGVVGSPVAQSLSPLIHGAWIAAAGLDALYAPFAAGPDGFVRFVEGLRGGVIRGLNVTVPFKVAALGLCERADAAAQAAGAANLILFDQDGSVEARNTDGIGLLYALTTSAPDWRAGSSAVAILGAGGAAAGAAAALVAAGVTDLRLVVRTPARARSLAERCGAEVYAWGRLGAALDGTGLVVNATTLGLHDVDPFRPPWPTARGGGVALDMVYRPLRTAFLETAARAGWSCVDGLDMLIGQARPSFRAFFDRDAPDLDVRAVCLGALGATASS